VEEGQKDGTDSTDDMQDMMGHPMDDSDRVRTMHRRYAGHDGASHGRFGQGKDQLNSTDDMQDMMGHPMDDSERYYTGTLGYNPECMKSFTLTLSILTVTPIRYLNLIIRQRRRHAGHARASRGQFRKGTTMHRRHVGHAGTIWTG
jgi:hypothetical protein